jgi:hypothetical protein
MIEGRMEWTSATREFGFFLPDDGSRSVFVRLSSNLPRLATGDRGPAPLLEEATALSARRPGSLDVIPGVFVPAHVRREGNGR